MNNHINNLLHENTGITVLPRTEYKATHKNTNVVDGVVVKLYKFCSCINTKMSIFKPSGLTIKNIKIIVYILLVGT